MLQSGYDQTPQVYDSTPDLWDRFTRRGMERDRINTMLRTLVLATAQHDDVVLLGEAASLPCRDSATCSTYA